MSEDIIYQSSCSGGDMFRERSVPVYKVDAILETVDYAIDSKRKKHIVGGILISLSLFLAGLAVTTITLKEEEDEQQDI